MPRALQQLLQIPPTKLWRILVYNPEPSKDLYQQFDEEPGSLAGMLNGLCFVISSWNRPISLDYIIQLHDVAVDHVYITQNYEEAGEIKSQLVAFDKGLRHGFAASFGIGATNLTEAGTADLLTRLQQGCRYFNIYRQDEPNPITLPTGLNVAHAAHDYYSLFLTQPHVIFTSNNVEIIKQEIRSAINIFQQQIHLPGDKLLPVAALLHELELIHGFSDGNCRTYGVLLLIKLLIQYNLELGILLDPNILDGHSLPEIAEQIRRAQRWIQDLFRNPNLIPDHTPFYLSSRRSSSCCKIM